MISSLLLLSATSSLLAWRGQNRRSHSRLIEQLASPARPVQDASPARLLTDGQNLALSLGVLGLTTGGYLGMPLLRLLSTPGLLYLDFYFIHTAYKEWQRQRQMGIATNDAVLATGLVVTRQWGAGALFATFFFVSRKLQALAEERLAYHQRLIAVGPHAAAAVHAAATDQPVEALTPDKPDWQSWIDRGARPLLLLSVVSTPLLGIKRALAVLLTNFGYDYRLVSPLSTLRYLQVAESRGIWLRDPHVLDRLLPIDVLVLAGTWDEQQAAALQAISPVPIMTTSALAGAAEIATLITALQAEGHTVAYLTTTVQDAGAAKTADLLIAVTQEADVLLPGAHVVLHNAQPAQLQQLFALTQALATTRQRGLYLALAPGVLNLGGIYFGHFGVISALLVDYGGSLLGLLNAVWLPAAAVQRGAAAPLFVQELTTPTLSREQQRSTADGTA